MASGETAFERALAHTLGIEGDYSDDAVDRGGATRWGITEAVARAHGYEGPMALLPLSVARGIYRDDYWESPRLPCGLIAAYDEAVAAELFDTGVNMGVVTAARFLQRAVNALNRNATLFADIAVDGWVGEATLDALRHLGTDTERSVLRKMLECQQGARYLELMEHDPAQERFARGWFDKRVGL